ncbi:HEAT repeat domain-containing protein [candidate division WOR-3 bacterium]|nr:HEAT repeat domain-containing protein [candidate division WOR-3 bacterium]
MGIFKLNVKKLKKKKDVEGLIKALKHKDWKIREDAAKVLGEIGDKEAVEPLIQAMKDDDRDTRRNAMLALEKIGKLAVEPLIKALDNKDADIRCGAVEALGEIGGEETIEPLIQAMKDRMKARQLVDTRGMSLDRYLEYNRYINSEAKKALIKIGKPAVPQLIKVLKSEESDVVGDTVDILGNIGDERAIKPLFQVLKNFAKEPYIRKTVAKALDRLGWKPENDKEKVYYLFALNKFKKLATVEKKALIPAIEPLIQMLKDEDNIVRSGAAKALALGEVGDERAVEPLIQMLKDENKWVRSGAAKALGKIGDERAVESLILAALKDEDANVRWWSAKALGKVGDERAVESLILAALKDKKYIRPGYLIDALRMIGWTPKDNQEKAWYLYVEFLIWVVENGDSLIEDTILILGDMGEKKAADSVVNWLFKYSKDIYNISSMFSALKNLFEDYTDLILKTACYKRIGNYSYSYPLDESIDALKRLYDIGGPISTNILHKVAQKKDALVIKEATQYGKAISGELSFEPLREMAKKELEQRGNPPYDPSAYLDKEAWKL